MFISFSFKIRQTLKKHKLSITKMITIHIYIRSMCVVPFLSFLFFLLFHRFFLRPCQSFHKLKHIHMTSNIYNPRFFFGDKHIIKINMAYNTLILPKRTTPSPHLWHTYDHNFLCVPQFRLFLFRFSAKSIS